MSAKTYNLDNDDITVPTSNVSTHSSRPRSYKVRAIEHIIKKEIAGGAFRLTTDNAIADLGATQIFVMDGTPVINKRPMMRPLKVLLADGRQVMSTYMCDIRINGLLVVLTGHIIPDLSIASLFRIRVLTEAGCKVTFTHDEYVLHYNNKIILWGEKNPSTDLWTLPLGSQGMTSQHANCVLPSAAPVVANAHAHPAIQIAFFIRYAPKQTASVLHTNLCAAHKFLPC
jgi:hypothetical protein